VSSKPPILAMSNLTPLFLDLLDVDYTVHFSDDIDALDDAVVRQIGAIAANGESRVDRALMQRLPALRVVAVMGVGYDRVDVAAALERGVAVTHTPGVLDDDVADLAIGLMLAWARQIPAADRFVRDGRWPSGALPLGRKLSGARLGIVGMGRIGQAIARRAAAFDMDIAYATRRHNPSVAHPHIPSLVALAERSDYLVVIVPGGAATHHLIDAEVLRALGPQGCLVNVARGPVVDQQALIAALQAGTLAGAALDVFEGEPDVPAALRALPQVVLAPHIGSATGATRLAMARLALANLAAGLAESPLHTPVPECC